MLLTPATNSCPTRWASDIEASVRRAQLETAGAGGVVVVGAELVVGLGWLGSLDPLDPLDPPEVLEVLGSPPGWGRLECTTLVEVPDNAIG